MVWDEHVAISNVSQVSVARRRHEISPIGHHRSPWVIRPALLAVNSKYEQTVNAIDAMATVFALMSIKKGRTYDQCIQEAVARSGQDSPTVSAVAASVAEVYRNLLGEDFDGSKLRTRPASQVIAFAALVK